MGYKLVKCGGRHRENPQGKDLGGFDAYLEGAGGNPSLVKIQGKFRKTNKNTMKTKEKLREASRKIYELIENYTKHVGKPSKASKDTKM